MVIAVAVMELDFNMTVRPTYGGAHEFTPAYMLRNKISHRVIAEPRAIKISSF
jgi:hypothetical protein